MSVESDLGRLDSALRQLFQTIKQPAYWRPISASAKLELDRPAATVLMLLDRPGVSPSVQAIASYLRVEAPSISRKADDLESAGLIKRRPSQKDRRSIELTLTPKGRSL